MPHPAHPSHTIESIVHRPAWPYPESHRWAERRQRLRDTTRQLPAPVGLSGTTKTSLRKGPYVILDNKSTLRLEKLYTSFIAYANDRLSVTDNLFRRTGRLNKEASFDVALEAFDTYRGDSLVADYLRVNPDGLSRTDLREIAQFGHAISGTFIVVRDGRDVLFLIPGFQIAVRGLIQEIDTIIREDLPVLVETVLLPFRNTIAFAFVLESHTDHIDTLEPGLIDDFRADSQTIRSVRDLILHEETIRMLTTLKMQPMLTGDQIY